MDRALTPKQVSRAIGVSESSVKRWCDRGVLPSVRTAGGHRRLTIDGVIQFLRATEHELVRPEVLGLPATTGRGQRVIDRSQRELRDALAKGDEELARQVVFDLYLAGNRVSAICDQVLVPAFREIGEQWCRQELQIYQERRGCEICTRLLHELRRALPSPPDDTPRAIGGTPEQDPYSMPSRMVELVLRECGWRASSLGGRLPLAAFRAAVEEHRPRLFWISVSHLDDTEIFLEDYRALHESIGPETAVVVGGRALTEPVRKRMAYTAYCDNLQHLETLAQTLAAPATNGIA